jgi:hypothetical protein
VLLVERRLVILLLVALQVQQVQQVQQVLPVPQVLLKVLLVVRRLTN